jgi:signal transduction histidine kinase
MDTQKLRETVSELEQELRDLKTVDDETRQMLREAVREIRAALRQARRSETLHKSLVQRLSAVAGKFESSHPAITDVITRLIDGLAQMGV